MESSGTRLAQSNYYSPILLYKLSFPQYLSHTTLTVIHPSTTPSTNHILPTLSNPLCFSDSNISQNLTRLNRCSDDFFPEHFPFRTRPLYNILGLEVVNEA